MKTYRVGIIGLGRMGSTIDDQLPKHRHPFSIAASCAQSKKLELVAGADIMPEKTEAFRAKWGITSTYEDYSEMIRKENLDLVAICTTATGLPKPGKRSPSPNFVGESHATISIEIAKSGVPMVFLEKAMACSMKKADDVLEAFTKYGTLLNTGVLRRFNNAYKAMRIAIERGDIGEPQTALYYGSTDLMHGHIHSIDTISYLLSDPFIKAVRGELHPQNVDLINNRLEEDPQASYQILFANNIQAWNIRANLSEYEIIGTNGSIRAINDGRFISLRNTTDTMDIESIRDNGTPLDYQCLLDKQTQTKMSSVPPSSPTIACLENLVASYENHQSTLGNVEVAHRTTEACIAIAESHHQSGTWITLPIANRDMYIFHV